MPTTRKQKKARKSRGLKILSDIENLDIMLGGDRYNGTERERSLDSNSVRRRESVISNNLDNEGESLFSNCRNDEPRTNADLGQNSAEVNSLAEINRLSSELNSRISREMDEMLNNVGIQIQRAINEAINSQVLPQIQNVMMAGSGRETRRDGRSQLRDRKQMPRNSGSKTLRPTVEMNNMMDTDQVDHLPVTFMTVRNDNYI